MGNVPTQQTGGTGSKFSSKFLQRIQKVSSQSSQRWGNYSIYQLQQKPYDYYLQYIQTSIPNSETLQQKLKFYQNMPTNKNLVPVQYADIVRRKQLCAEFDGLRVFCIYYNFTLEEAIKVKIKQKYIFTEPELIYILRTLLSVGKFYQNQLKATTYSGIYQTKQVFVTPQGHIKVYPFNENLFTAYASILHSQSKFDNEIVDNKKFSIQLPSGNKEISESRSELGFSRSGLSRSQSGVRKSKLTTTLGKDYLGSTNSQKYFEWKSEELMGKSMHQGRDKLLYQVSQECVGLDYKKSVRSSRKDLFQLGLLMMQLMLLNESHQYYVTRSSYTSVNQSLGFGNKGEFQQGKFQRHNVNSLVKNQSVINNFKLKQFQDQLGRIPNVDLIEFSLTNLLPKRNISPIIVSIIQKLIFNHKEDLNYQDLLQTVQKYQETLRQPKYCLRFDPPNNDQDNQQHSEKQHSRYMIKNKSIDPFTRTTNLSSPALGNADSSFQSNINPISQSKESFYPQKLQDLLNASNLTKSMIFEGEDQHNSSQVLDNLKKSRKLIPNKIRSVSIKTSKEKTNNIETSNSQHYGITFG